MWCSPLCNVHFCFVHSALSSAAALMFKSPLSPLLFLVKVLLCPPSNPRSNCANFQAVCYVTESSISVTQCHSVDKYTFKKWQIDVLQFGEIHFAIWRNTICDFDKYVAGRATVCVPCWGGTCGRMPVSGGLEKSQKYGRDLCGKFLNVLCVGKNLSQLWIIKMRPSKL